MNETARKTLIDRRDAEFREYEWLTGMIRSLEHQITELKERADATRKVWADLVDALDEAAELDVAGEVEPTNFPFTLSFRRTAEGEILECIPLLTDPTTDPVHGWNLAIIADSEGRMVSDFFSLAIRVGMTVHWLNRDGTFAGEGVVVRREDAND